MNQCYRRILPSDYEAVKAHIHQQLQTQVIGESGSSFAFSLSWMREKDGSLKMCVDYR